MKSGVLLAVVACMVLLFPAVSAEIFLEQPRSLYSVGDVFVLNASLESEFEETDFFRAFLSCSGKEVEIHKSVQVSGPQNIENIQIKTALSNFVMPNISGECYIRTTFSGLAAESQRFEVSRGIRVNTEVEGVSFSPGDVIKIKGDAVKRNGERLEGFVEIVFEGIKGGIHSKSEEEGAGSDESEPESVNESGADEPGDSIRNESESGRESEGGENESDSGENSNGGELYGIPEELWEAKEKESEKKEDSTGVNISGSARVVSRVENGEFSVEFEVPEFTPPGNYKMKVRAYESDGSGFILNEGTDENEIKINQVIKEVGLAFNKNSITPGSEFLYTPILYDQADGEGEGEVEIKVLRPDGEVFYEKLVRAGQSNSIETETNFTTGYWKVIAKYQDIERDKLFFVEELELISSRLKDERLLVENIGNVPYTKPIEISIGGVTKVKELNLGLGESRMYRLEAPDGSYEVGINDGSEMESLGTSFLTGRVISVDEMGSFIGQDFMILVWLFAIVVLFSVAFVAARKIRKSNFVGRMPRIIRLGKKNSAGTGGGSIISSGRKEEASVISLKIKNLDSLNTMKEDGLQAVNQALITAKNTGGKIYVDGNNRIVIFSKTTTSQKDNSFRAVNVGKQIQDVLNSHNRQSKKGIEYGIGVNSGDLAVESSGHSVKFAPLGNTISIAKRISETSNSEVLMSEQIYKKILGKVKGEKMSDTGFWRIKRIVDREENSDFINSFLNRNKSSFDR